MPRRSQQSWVLSGLNRAWIFEFGSGLSEAEHDPLIVPGERQARVREQLLCRQIARLPPIEDRLGNIRRE